METVKCVRCDAEIEYTEIIGDEYYAHDHRTGLIDLVARDNICIACEPAYYDEK